MRRVWFPRSLRIVNVPESIAVSVHKLKDRVSVKEVCFIGVDLAQNVF
jgi:hypothetical protein